MNAQTLKGNWNEISGKIREKWGQLTGDELRTASGDFDQLVGLIQRKTGETRDSIEHLLDQFAGQGGAAVEGVRQTASRFADSARDYGQRASRAMGEASGNVVESIRGRYSDAEQVVRDNPGSSLLAVFGTGLLVGVFFGMIFRR